MEILRSKRTPGKIEDENSYRLIFLYAARTPHDVLSYLMQYASEFTNALNTTEKYSTAYLIKNEDIEKLWEEMTDIMVKRQDAEIVVNLGQEVPGISCAVLIITFRMVQNSDDVIYKSVSIELSPEKFHRYI